MQGPKRPYLLLLSMCRPCVVVGTSYVLWVELPVQRRLFPDFREYCRVTRHSRVFRGLTGCQRTPGEWGVTAWYQSLGTHLGLGGLGLRPRVLECGT